jgi:hypothetical protein
VIPAVPLENLDFIIVGVLHEKEACTYIDKNGAQRPRTYGVWVFGNLRIPLGALDFDYSHQRSSYHVGSRLFEVTRIDENKTYLCSHHPGIGERSDKTR